MPSSARPLPLVQEPARPQDRSGRRSRVLVVTADPLKPQMAGPAIRAWQVALLLAEEHEVRLRTTAECALTSDRLDVGHLGSQAEAAELEAWCDVLLYQGNAIEHFRSLQATSKVVVIDMYDPFLLEQLEQTRHLDPPARRRVIASAAVAANGQCLRGDFLVCASEKQRDLWLGHLAAIGRLNAATYDSDVTLRSLIDVAPFGISPTPPQRTRPAIKGVVDGIGPDDKVVLWGGGIYNWFDPLTLIRAVDALRARRPEVRLFFLGMQHPNPGVPEMEMSFAARELATQLGLTGTHVFFNEQWVQYDERADYLLDADVGVSTHLDHVETAFSFRTRMLDYLWAGLPMVCTQGDVFAAMVEDRGLGLTVPPGDVDALAHALEKVLFDDELGAQAREALRRTAPEFHWPRALAPVVEFCRDPRRAADAREDHSRRRLARRAREQYRPRSGLRRQVDIAVGHLEDGGVRVMARKAVDRVARQLRR